MIENHPEGSTSQNSVNSERLNWVDENRLPSDTEIENKRGFPTEEEEVLLRNRFFEKFRPIAIEFVKNKLEEAAHLTENQLQLFLSLLYGIYLYNYISGGRVMSPEFNNRLRERSETSVLTLENLEDWPVNVSSAVGESVSPASFTTLTMSIDLALDKIRDDNPDGLAVVDAKKANGFLFGSAQYTSTLENVFIRSGMEEAAHLDFFTLRANRIKAGYEKNDRKVIARLIPLTHDLNQSGPLRDLGEREKIETAAMRKRQIIDYDSLLGDEFAAHIIQAEFTKRFDHFCWTHGFERVDKLIRQNRKKKLARMPGRSFRGISLNDEETNAQLESFFIFPS